MRHSVLKSPTHREAAVYSYGLAPQPGGLSLPVDLTERKAFINELLLKYGIHPGDPASQDVKDDPMLLYLYNHR
jgi:hypothetical protein